MDKIKVLLPFAVGLVMFLSIVAFTNNDKPVVNDKVFKKVEFNIDKRIRFEEDSLIKELKNLDIQHIDIVIKQARLETGHYKSLMFKNKHNLFGFRNRKGYMTFKSWRECCVFYGKWQNKHYKGGDYYQCLIDSKFAEDSTYINKLKSM